MSQPTSLTMKELDSHVQKLVAKRSVTIQEAKKAKAILEESIQKSHEQIEEKREGNTEIVNEIQRRSDELDTINFDISQQAAVSFKKLEGELGNIEQSITHLKETFPFVAQQ